MTRRDWEVDEGARGTTGLTEVGARAQAPAGADANAGADLQARVDASPGAEAGSGSNVVPFPRGRWFGSVDELVPIKTVHPVRRNQPSATASEARLEPPSDPPPTPSRLAVLPDASAFWDGDAIELNDPAALSAQPPASGTAAHDSAGERQSHARRPDRAPALHASRRRVVLAAVAVVLGALAVVAAVPLHLLGARAAPATRTAHRAGAPSLSAGATTRGHRSQTTGAGAARHDPQALGPGQLGRSSRPVGLLTKAATHAPARAPSRSRSTSGSRHEIRDAPSRAATVSPSRTAAAPVGSVPVRSSAPPADGSGTTSAARGRVPGGTATGEPGPGGNPPGGCVQSPDSGCLP